MDAVNAFTLHDAGTLTALLHWIGEDTDVRSLELRVFSNGLDYDQADEFAGMDLDFTVTLHDRIYELGHDDESYAGRTFTGVGSTLAEAITRALDVAAADRGFQS